MPREIAQRHHRPRQNPSRDLLSLEQKEKAQVDEHGRRYPEKRQIRAAHIEGISRGRGPEIGQFVLRERGAKVPIPTPAHATNQSRMPWTTWRHFSGRFLF